MPNNIPGLKSFFDSKVAWYEQPSFIKDDPISIPHRFTKKQDIEIAGFFAAIGVSFGAIGAMAVGIDCLSVTGVTGA